MLAARPPPQLHLIYTTARISRGSRLPASAIISSTSTAGTAEMEEEEEEEEGKREERVVQVQAVARLIRLIHSTAKA